MRLAVIIFICTLSALPGRAQSPAQAAAAEPLTLRLTEREAIARLLSSDPRIRALDAEIDEVRAIQVERRLWPNPSVTFSRESVAGAHDTFLLGRQELPISGRLGRLRVAGRLAVDAARATVRFEKAQLEADVREAYTVLLLAQQREDALQGSVDGLERLVSVLRTREEAGEGSTYDRMRGERALVDLEAERSLAAADRVRAQGRLAAYLGQGAAPETLSATDSLLPGPSPPPPVRALVEQALTNRGDYRAAEISVGRFEAERSAANRLQVPIPSLTGGLKRSDIGGRTNAGYQVALDLDIPLFDRGQAAAARASAQKTRAQAATESSRLQIEAGVRAAHTVVTIHQDRLARYRESISAVAEPLGQVGRVGYEEGELGILEALDAERQALDARLMLWELAAAVRRASIELDRLVGVELNP